MILICMRCDHNNPVCSKEMLVSKCIRRIVRVTIVCSIQIPYVAFGVLARLIVHALHVELKV